jgi:hypothetical protein
LVSMEAQKKKSKLLDLETKNGVEKREKRRD